jgi:hypothetical protein
LRGEKKKRWKEFLYFRFQVRPSTFFQKCRDQQSYINQLLRTQQQHLTQIKDLRDRLDREMAKNTNSNYSSSSSKANIFSVLDTDQPLEMGDSAVAIKSENQVQKQSRSTDQSCEEAKRPIKTESLNDFLLNVKKSCKKEQNNQPAPATQNDFKSKDSDSVIVSVSHDANQIAEHSSVLDKSPCLTVSFSSPNLRVTTSFSSSSDSVSRFYFLLISSKLSQLKLLSGRRSTGN